jgi:hypothetical protein
MKAMIDRSLCDHVLPECERCFARFVRDPLSVDRPCITGFEDDGDPTLHVGLRYDGQEETLVLSPEECELVASEGWSQFVKVPPKFYRE